MKKVIKAFTLAVLMTGCTAQQIQQAQKTLGGYLGEDKVSTEEVVKGLKEALVQGTGKGVATVSQVNGYLGNAAIRIPFPPEVQKVEQKLRDLGFGKQVDQFVETLNHGAEEAAKEAKPIFVNAITAMSIQDAWNILKGADDAAAAYLISNTSTQLQASFKPVIQRALEKTSATKYYSDLINTYNKIPFVEKVNPNLDDYATQKAIDGLFVMIAKEEKNIRDNPGARATELLKRVFSQQD